MKSLPAEADKSQARALASKEKRAFATGAAAKNNEPIPRHRVPHDAFEALPQIVARLRPADRCAFFLDFDGTLVAIRNHPGDVRSTPEVESVLRNLIAHPSWFVAIVSGRRVRDLRRLIGIVGLVYLGLHGAERDGKLAVTLRQKTRLALACARRAAQQELAELPRVWIEDKGLSFCVHHRGAGPDTTRTARVRLESVLQPWSGLLYVLEGKRIWEVLPRELPGKGAAVRDALAGLAPGTQAVYVGDDDTDETAFAALPDQTTIRVGKIAGTHAQYWLRAPADVLRFLTQLERELR